MTGTTGSTAPTGADQARQLEQLPVATEYDGGDMDCGSGLLLAITSRIRAIDPGETMLLHTTEPSVLADLPAWARLAGHELVGTTNDEGDGAWRLWVRRGEARTAGSRAPAPEVEYSSGAPAPLGTRLWLYSNFHCNLACAYCCAGSSPQAEARLMPVEMAASAATEFAAQGGRELLVTGGEPFLHPELGALVAATSAEVPVTLLTNAMVFERGRRRETLESFDRDRVVLQISLDSVGPGLHDRQRGKGSHAKAMSGIRLASELGFTVRVAATYTPEDAGEAGDLHRALGALGIAEEDQLIRPVAHEGFAEGGVEISLDTVEPEPTLTADGAWWHPVGVTNRHLKVADAPLPVAHVLDVMRDVVEVQQAAGDQGRTVFRCT
ncbi:radical SAM protein [Nocardioides donggukensis]|uniref:Radical SAM protein n=1 Tax=Nocardioides donggukensis TaxID=2774019 RepID=A0A927K5E0_9ACTN|nr:radical SAM protein [Nocardioides donggukensis]MBD8871062.1 radical SAM protein [Nocardioides donggukensis]